MANVNTVILAGRLTRDPELTYVKQDTAIAKLGLAINEYRGTGETRKEVTCYVDVTVFGRQAETVSQYLAKGREVLIVGKLDYQSWEDKDGNKRHKLGVIAERVQFLGAVGKGAPSSPGGEPVDEEDDVPF